MPGSRERRRPPLAAFLRGALPLLVASCGSPADDDEPAPPLPVSGTIEGWSLGEGKQVVATTCTGTDACYEVGSGPVSAIGEFQLALENPSTSSAWSSLCTAGVVRPADVRYASVGFRVTEGGAGLGALDLASARSQRVVPGDLYGFFRWVDQDATASGVASCDGVSWNYLQVGLAKGWNELTTDAVSSNERNVTSPHSADLSWHLFGYGLGYACDSGCTGTTCSRGGGGYGRLCPDSDLDLPCIGTAAGMFCSKSCTSDVDCENDNEPMKCLTACETFPSDAGKCWTVGAHAFLTEQVCP